MEQNKIEQCIEKWLNNKPPGHLKEIMEEEYKKLIEEFINKKEGNKQ